MVVKFAYLSRNVVLHVVVYSEVSCACFCNSICSLAEESYRAFRSTLFVQNVSAIPLNETGPLINLQSIVQNTRHTDNGTTIPRLTLKIHLPVEVKVEEGEERRYLPVVIPTEVLAGLGNVNCSHYNAVPLGLVRLSPSLHPSSHLPPSLYTSPSPNIPHSLSPHSLPYKSPLHFSQRGQDLHCPLILAVRGVVFIAAVSSSVPSLNSNQLQLLLLKSLSLLGYM